MEYAAILLRKQATLGYAPGKSQASPLEDHNLVVHGWRADLRLNSKKKNASSDDSGRRKGLKLPMAFQPVKSKINLSEPNPADRVIPFGILFL